MLHTFLAAMLLCGQLVAMILGCPVADLRETNSMDSTHNIARRWYSVNRDKPPGPPERWWGSEKWWGAWPWNPDCGKYQIRYCFENQRTMDDTLEVFLHAIARWGPALQGVSGLEIIPDPSCGRSSRCLCQGNEASDTLVIKYAGPHVSFQASLGYSYGSEERGRHYLRGDSQNFRTGLSEPQQKSEAVRNFLHELGHVIGLKHEHARPDANLYIDFNCGALDGYAQASAAVQAVHDSAFTAADTPEERMKKVCSDRILAEKYFPSAFDFLPGDGGRESSTYSVWVYGPIFDHRSIMIYGSQTGARMFDIEDKRTWVFSLKLALNPDWRDHLKFLVVPGGSYDPEYATISEGDIWRVQLLYPIGGPPPVAVGGSHKRDSENTSAEKAGLRNITIGNTTVGHWPPVKFVMPDVITTTVRSAPFVEPTGMPKLPDIPLDGLNDTVADVGS